MEDKLRWFEYEHLPSHLREISRECAELAYKMAQLTPETPQRTLGLQKLIEAKDCFVRAKLSEREERT